MRNIFVELQMGKAADDLKKCLCYLVQIDGSTYRQQIDLYFVTTVFIPSNEIIGPSSLSWNFKQRQRGRRTIDSTHVLRTLVGGNANIGKKERLWKPLGCW